MIYEELTVNGKNYLLVHGGLEVYPGKIWKINYKRKKLIWDRAEYDINILRYICGDRTYTDTKELWESKTGLCIQEDHHIAIDCET